MYVHISPFLFSFLPELSKAKITCQNDDNGCHVLTVCFVQSAMLSILLTLFHPNSEVVNRVSHFVSEETAPKQILYQGYSASKWWTRILWVFWLVSSCCLTNWNHILNWRLLLGQRWPSSFQFCPAKPYLLKKKEWIWNSQDTSVIEKTVICISNTELATWQGLPEFLKHP